MVTTLVRSFVNALARFVVAWSVSVSAFVGVLHGVWVVALQAVIPENKLSFFP